MQGEKREGITNENKKDIVPLCGDEFVLRLQMPDLLLEGFMLGLQTFLRYLLLLAHPGRPQRVHMTGEQVTKQDFTSS